MCVALAGWTVTAALLVLHVIAAIILIGPITVAASVFPRYVRAAGAGDGDARAAAASAAAMHRISRVYAVPALAVPVFGIATGAALGVLGQAWLIIAMVLTALAGVLLVATVLPGQRAALQMLAGADPVPDAERRARRLGITAGIFATTWAVVVVLMIVRPGSTTGV